MKQMQTINSKYAILIVLLFAIGFLIPILSVSAATTTPTTTPVTAPPAKSGSQVVKLTNPLGDEKTSIEEIVGRAVTAVLGIVGALTLLVFIAGGFMWLTSAGAEDKIKRGLNMMLYAALGLLVIFGAYGILQSVLNALLK